jgi:hypothetical protein
MPSSGTLRRAAIVRTEVSEECIVSIIRVTISGLGTTLTLTGNRSTLLFLRSVGGLLVTANVVSSSLIFVTLMMEALHSSEISVLTRSTWRNIPEDGIPQNYRLENLKSCEVLIPYNVQ